MNHTLKRILTLMLALLLVLGVCACTPEPQVDSDPRNVFAGSAADLWSYEKGKGTFSFSIPADSRSLKTAPHLLKAQLEGEWMLHTQINYNSAAPDSDTHAGILLYVDEENYLIWGQRNNATLELSGRIAGRDTGALATSDTLYPHLRIWKVTRDGEADRYYVYGAKDAYYSWHYVGYYEDKDKVFAAAQYGLGGWDGAQTGNGYCVSFEFCDDFVIYNYKDTFKSGLLDGRWVNTLLDSGTAATQNGKVVLTAGDTPAVILRNPLPYDWTVECQAEYREDTRDASALVVWADEENYLAVGGDKTQLTARAVIGGAQTDLGTCDTSAAKFLKIVKRDAEYKLMWSEQGSAWELLGSWTDTSGALEKAQYGLLAEKNNTASFEWFNERATPDGIIRDVVLTEQVAKITGENSVNQTESRWGWGSGDLGSMFYLDGAVYMCFGDTYQFENQRGNWYRNSMAKITDLESYKTGLKFDWMRKTSATCDHGLVGGRPGGDDQSIIATSGIGINQNGVNTLYMHLMYIRKWVSYGTHWEINGSTWAYSTDDGATWKVQPCMFEGDTHFAQIACHQVGDEVYIWGAGITGTSAVRLAKVPAAQILDRSAYRFFTGTDEKGEPMWSEREDDAVPVIDSLNREFSVAYNPGLNCYLMTTLDNVNQQMILRDAENPWGPWSKPVLLFDESYVQHEDPVDHHFYGCFMNSQFMDNGGKTVYMTLNKWVPYNIVWMKVDFAVEEGR